MSTLSPEFRLVAACSIWPSSERRLAAISVAAASAIDWPQLLRVARRHRVAALVGEGLRAARVALPCAIQQALHSDAVATSRQNLRFASEAWRLQRRFIDAGIALAFIKGVPLALRVYGSLGLRQSKDIDVLVGPDDVEPASALLARAGYGRVRPEATLAGERLQHWCRLNNQTTWVHRGSGIEIDLHWRLSNFSAIWRQPLERLEALPTVEFSPGRALTTIGEERLLLYLCVHGAGDGWCRLKWLADIAALLNGSSERDIDDLYRSAERCGADRAVGQALLLCERLLLTELPPTLKRQLQSDRAQRSLDWLALLAMNRGRGAIELQELAFGSTLISLSHLLLIRGWRERLVHVARAATHPADLLALPLPRWLQMAYPLLRLPLWCWRRSGAPRWVQTLAARCRALPLLLEAMLWLLFARLLLAWLPFRAAARLFAWPVRGCHSPAAARLPVRVRWAVRAAARRVPWRASCFHQAIAAQRMLCRRGIATDMVYGVQRTAGQTLEAHVWAAIGGRVIVGARAARAYRPIAVFRPGAAAAAHERRDELPRRDWRR